MKEYNYYIINLFLFQTEKEKNIHKLNKTNKFLSAHLRIIFKEKKSQKFCFRRGDTLILSEKNKQQKHHYK